MFHGMFRIFRNSKWNVIYPNVDISLPRCLALFGYFVRDIHNVSEHVFVPVLINEGNFFAHQTLSPWIKLELVVSAVCN